MHQADTSEVVTNLVEGLFRSPNFLKRLTIGVLLILPSVIMGASLWLRMNGDMFPPFHDGGNWLKLANALVGNAYPMWEQTTLQYPPLFNALLALIGTILGDALLAIKLLGLLVVALMPLAIYPLAREIGGSWKIGLIAAWLMAFHPIFQEMYGWGGYPNALGLLVLFGALYFLVKVYHEKSMKYLVGSLVFSSLVILSHHLTTIVFFAIALGWALFYLWMRFIRKASIDDRGMLRVALCFAVALVVFVLWRLAAGPFQYVVFNPSSLSVRPFDLEAFWWIFKSESLTTLLFLTSILGSAALFLQRRRVELVLLAMWVFLPLAFTQTYIFGIALDFKRLPIFSVPALAILSSCSFLLVQGRSVSFAKSNTSSSATKSKPNPSNPLYLKVDIWVLLVIAVVVSLLCSVTLVGAAAQQSVFVYYHHITDYTYNDEERLEALNWIRENTLFNAVIVADDALGRWIEGFAARRVVMRLPPFQAFMLSEVDRYKAADLLLHSNLEVRNEFVRLRDGTPYWTRETPLFSISKGNDFKDLFYVVDAYNRVSFMFNDTRWVEAPYKPESFLMNWLEKNSSRVTTVMEFYCQSLLINKTLSLEAESSEATLRYHVTPLKPIELESMDVALWIPPGASAKASWFEAMPMDLEIGGEPILLWSDPAPQYVELSPDPESGQSRILITYAPLNDEFDVTLQFAFPSAVKSTWSVGVEGLTSDEVIEIYHVTHIAVGKRLYDMERLYQDPRFRQVHSNSKIAVFEVKTSMEE